VFFEQLIVKYLSPVDARREAAKKEEMSKGLKRLRNACCFFFVLLNAFWILILFTLQLFKDKLKEKIYIKVSLFGVNEAYEPVSFVYVMMFVVMLFLQFFAMLWHRAITLIQIVRKTSLRVQSFDRKTTVVNSELEKAGGKRTAVNGHVVKAHRVAVDNLVFENEDNII
jgi:chitin synthase